MAGFTDSDFVQPPSLKKLMSIADDIYFSKKGGVATVYPPDAEAKQLAERLNGKHRDQRHRHRHGRLQEMMIVVV